MWSRFSNVIFAQCRVSVASKTNVPNNFKNFGDSFKNNLNFRRFCSEAPKSKNHFQSESNRRKRALAAYATATAFGMFGLAYAGVPLYRLYCQATGTGTKADLAKSSADRVLAQTKVKDRVISIKFNADVASQMTWNFKPLQREIKVVPGETALAFYTARNPEPEPVIGVATYNIVPYDAAQYFTKIQVNYLFAKK